MLYLYIGCTKSNPYIPGSLSATLGYQINLKTLSIMDKFEFTWQCRDNNAFGFITDAETMDLIIDMWTAENGGRMNNDELCEMVEYIEDEMNWYWMAHLMHGYLWGASTDDKYELMGEHLALNRRAN